MTSASRNRLEIWNSLTFNYYDIESALWDMCVQL